MILSLLKLLLDFIALNWFFPQKFYQYLEQTINYSAKRARAIASHDLACGETRLLLFALFQYGWKITHSTRAFFNVYLPIYEIL